MSLISFIQDAGEKLFHTAKAAPAASAPAAAAAATPDIAALNATAAQAIERYIGSQGLKADQATREKIVLCCGNVAAVAKVDDLLTVADGGGQESTYREVKAGDTLSKIASRFGSWPCARPRCSPANVAPGCASRRAPPMA